MYEREREREREREGSTDGWIWSTSPENISKKKNNLWNLNLDLLSLLRRIDAKNPRNLKYAFPSIQGIMNKCVSVCECVSVYEGMGDWMLSTCLDYQRRMGNAGVGNNTQIFNIYKWTYRTWQTSTLTAIFFLLIVIELTTAVMATLVID